MRRSGIATIAQKPGHAAYKVTPEIDRAPALGRAVSLTGGRYSVTVARAGLRSFEASTESPPFVHGRAPTLQGAFDSLERRYREEVESGG